MTLRRTNEERVEGEPSGNEHVDSWRDQVSTAANEERHMKHLELQELGDKYVEIAK